MDVSDSSTPVRCSDSGHLLLELCVEQGLNITNTLFQQKARFKTTWRHPCSKHWQLMDYTLVHQLGVRYIRHTCVMPMQDIRHTC
ncbi:hypothetical protein ACOMHN_012443 [Nucella lapillus]